MFFILRRIALVAIASLAPTLAAQSPAVLHRGEAAPREAREAWSTAHPGLTTPDVVLVTIEALRPGMLGAYEPGRRGLTPALDALASEGVVFDAAFAPSSDPTAALHGLVFGQFPSLLATSARSGARRAFGDVLGGQGVRTWGFVASSPFESLPAALGPAPASIGIDRTWREFVRNTDRIPKLVDRVTEGLLESVPAVGWIYLPFPRPPAQFHPGFDLGSSSEQHYDAAVRYCDAVVGNLVARLQDGERGARTIIIVTGVSGLADAGDAARWDDEASLRVPLLIHVPGGEARRVATPVSTLDLAPTICDLVRGSVSPTFVGRSLLPTLAGGEPAARVAYSERLDEKGRPEGRTLRGTGFRLTEEDGRPVLRTIDAKGVERIVNDAERTAEYGGWLADLEAYGLEARVVWEEDPDSRPAHSGDRLAIARALNVEREAPQEARGVALGLLGSGEEDVVARALRMLARIGRPEDADRVRPLLSHPRPNIATLAAAVMVGVGRTREGLDLARDGFPGLTESGDRVAVVTAFGRTDDAEVRRALEALPVDDGDHDLVAARSLALVRLGDESAVRRLTRLVLDPRGSFRRRAAVRALVEHLGEGAVGILDLMLSHAAGDEDGLHAAIESLRTLGGRGAAPGLARAVAVAPESVAAEAARLLRDWDLPLAAEALRAQVAEEDSAERAALAFSRLLDLRYLIGSPVLGGVIHARGEGPAIVWKPSAHRFDEWKGGAGRIAVVLDATLPGRSLAEEDVTIQAFLNDDEERLETIHLVALPGGGTLWLGRCGATALRQGSNTLNLRFSSRVDKSLGATLRALAFLPDEGLGGTPYLGFEAEPGVTTREAVGRLSPDSRRFLLWGRASGPLAGASGRLVLMRGEREIASLSLAEGQRSGRIGFDLPRRPRPDEVYRLVWTGPVPATVSALVYSTR